MKALVLILAVMTTVSTTADARQARERAAQVTTGSAVLTGTVTTDGEPAMPLRRVAVTLNDVGGAYGATAVTDAAGRFSFSNLPAGRYNVVASRLPYVTTRHGAREIGRAGTPLAIEDGESRSIALKMPLGAVITGVVRDERGMPVPGVGVEVMASRFFSGRRSLQRVVGIRVTDDRGVYRAFGLPPGEYYVSVRAPVLAGQPAIEVTTPDEVRRALSRLPANASTGPIATTTPAGLSTAAPPPASPNVGYARVYYPGTTSEADASPLTLGPAEVHDGIDVQLQFVPVVTVSGRATLPDGGPALFARGQIAPTEGNLEIRLGAVFANQDGEFTLRGVPPGRYAVALMAASKPNPEGRRLPTDPPDHWGVARISVAGEDITDVAVQMRPTMTLSGRASFEGAGDPPNWPGVRVGLFPHVTGGDVATTTGNRPLQADGTFELDGLTPGRYLVTVAVPAGYMARAVRVGGQETLDVPVAIEQGMDPAALAIEVDVTDRLSSLTGVFEDASGRPATDYQMVVFPADRRYWDATSRRIKVARPATDGRFLFPALPPGAYRLAALTDVEDGEWLDPSFLERLLPAAIEVTVVDGEQAVQNIRIAGGSGPS